MAYVKQPMKAPRLSGRTLEIAVSLMEGPLAGPLRRKTLSDMGIETMRRATVDRPIAFGPRLPEGTDDGRAIDLDALARTSSSARGFRAESISDFARAYRDGSSSPTDVAARVLAHTKASEEHAPPLRVFIAQSNDDVMRQAEASAARFKAGAPLSILDGVPVAIKDELDVAGYRTTVGTRYLGDATKDRDATVVERLRAKGAVIIGKANMHEIGITPTGQNPHHGACRNPVDPRTDAGGSSSGPAAAVAAGLCPLSIGADGGGSIRIPAAFCGLVGLKATWGRISEHGAFPLCWSVGHVGPLASSAVDCAVGYAAIAGRDPHDTPTMRQPSPVVDDLGGDDISGLRLGVYSAWLDDADANVVQATRRTIASLVSRGARVVEIDLPDLELLQLAHVLTIVSEMRGSILRHVDAHRKDMGLNVRMILSLAESITSSDYVAAQRIRTLFSDRFEALYRTIDVLVTPTTACTAPVIKDDAIPKGESDIPQIDAIMRFVRPGNFIGYPAVSFPCGYDASGLPVGFQAMARPWEESLLLRLARIGESLVERRPPMFHRRLLSA